LPSTRQNVSFSPQSEKREEGIEEEKAFLRDCEGERGDGEETEGRRRGKGGRGGGRGRAGFLKKVSNL